MSKLYRTTSWRRILAFAVAFTMVFSVFGTSGYTVFAEDTGYAEAIEQTTEPMLEESQEEVSS